MARPTFSVFITGGTGYIGAPLIRSLVERGHHVRALVRPGSENKLPPGAEGILGNALDASSYAAHIQPSHTFVQLVGVAHPSPAKAAEFQAIDRESALGAISAARQAGVQHFIYLSVAQPAPVMKSYQRVRAECETALLQSWMNVTIVRPWYVLGPGHRWPYVLLPMYWLFERIALNSRWRAPPGPGNAGTNDANFALGRRKPQYWRAFHRGATNSQGQCHRLIARRHPSVSPNYESAWTWDIF